MGRDRPSTAFAGTRHAAGLFVPLMATKMVDPMDVFRGALDRFEAGKPVLIMTHNDADGLTAGALFARMFERLGRAHAIRVVGRGQNPWSPAIREEYAGAAFGGLIVADLGLREGAVLPGVPTIVVDHHVPTGVAGGATIVTGYGADPIPSTSLLAHRCAGTVVDTDAWLWLAAIGLIGDYGDKAPFPELAEAKARYTATALREATSLVNAPRRTAMGDAAPALALLMTADDPKDAISGRHAGTATLRAAREEVKAAVEVGKRVGPRVHGDVAVIHLDTPCQIHPLIAQAWRTRLKDKVVIAANHGYREGWVHFAARSVTGRNLITFLREVAPPGADEAYGNGHEQATGGALRLDDWHAFLRNIGVDEPHAGARKVAA